MVQGVSALLACLRCPRGATAVEYGLLAAMFAVGSIVAFEAFGDSLLAMWSFVSASAASVMS